jgi:hypothetical protein
MTTLTPSSKAASIRTLIRKSRPPMPEPLSHRRRRSLSVLIAALITMAIATSGISRSARVERLLGPSVPSGLEIDTALALAASYFVGATFPDGRFRYQYDPRTDTDISDYNMVRHAGAVGAMWDLVATSKDTALANAAARATQFLIASVDTCRVGGVQGRCLRDGEWVTLGANALTVIAFLKKNAALQDTANIELARDLGRMIVASMDSTGEFVHQKVHANSGLSTDLRSAYYAGEAALALALLARDDRASSWKGATVKATGALYREVKTETLFERGDDHWQLYAFSALYALAPTVELYKGTKLIVAAIAVSQQSGPWPPGRRGAFDGMDRSAPSATRVEGLMAAYDLFVHADSVCDAELAVQTARRGLAWVMAAQIDPATARSLPNAPRAVGGIAGSRSDREIRIDYVQHAVSAMLAVRRASISDYHGRTCGSRS